MNNTGFFEEAPGVQSNMRLSSDGQGKTIYGFPSSTALGQHREWRYDATTGAWY